MPLYEYRCESCEHQFEVIQKFSDPHVSVCPKCGSGPVVKLISSPAFTFKGTGFYITDYARKDQGKTDQDKSGGSSSSADTSNKSDTSTKSGESTPAATDTKPASSSDSAATKSTPKTEG